MLNIFAVTFVATAAGITGAAIYGGWDAVTVAIMLSVLEITLSFDNAIVNATILNGMDPIWRMRFLTYGIIIAVFGMRLIFPIALVACVTHLNPWEVFILALDQPELYSSHLIAAHGSLSSFGGCFLLMVFLGFLFDHKRDIHWLGVVEAKISKIGALESMEAVFAMLILLFIQSIVPEHERASILVSGMLGIVTYVIIHSLAKFMSTYYRNPALGKNIKHAGVMSFVYLEVLDASFSFDGVLGAFAITKDIVIIMIGLGIGAFFVRSITIMLVERKTLQNYIYLEHGAHYALGALSFMMLLSIRITIPEIFIGTVGLVLIMLSFVSSVLYKKRLPDPDKHPLL